METMRSLWAQPRVVSYRGGRCLTSGTVERAGLLTTAVTPIRFLRLNRQRVVIPRLSGTQSVLTVEL